MLNPPKGTYWNYRKFAMLEFDLVGTFLNFADMFGPEGGRGRNMILPISGKVSSGLNMDHVVPYGPSSQPISLTSMTKCLDLGLNPGSDPSRAMLKSQTNPGPGTEPGPNPVKCLIPGHGPT